MLEKTRGGGGGGGGKRVEILLAPLRNYAKMIQLSDLHSICHKIIDHSSIIISGRFNGIKVTFQNPIGKHSLFSYPTITTEW